MQNNANNKNGTLYGIGVGPGDPELIPVKAIRVLQKVDLVFSASSSKNKYSLAVETASEYLPSETPIRILPFPMTMDKSIAQKAWEENAQVIIRELEQARDVAFLTLGDPLTYSTFGYLIRHLRKSSPYCRICTIPGITSYQAAAAVTNTPLVEGEENLLLLSGIKGGQGLRKIQGLIDNVIFLKAYKNVSDITKSIQESGQLQNCKAIVNCGLEDQEIIDNLSELCRRKPEYWTLIIAKQDNGNKK